MSSKRLEAAMSSKRLDGGDGELVGEESPFSDRKAATASVLDSMTLKRTWSSKKVLPLGELVKDGKLLFPSMRVRRNARC
eukprot:2613369-Rhodomonas_salina.2